MTTDKALARCDTPDVTTRYPELSDLGPGWQWEENPAGTILLWGTKTAGAGAITLGVFIYTDGEASVIRLDYGMFFHQTRGTLAHVVSVTNELLRMPANRW